MDAWENLCPDLSRSETDDLNPRKRRQKHDGIWNCRVERNAEQAAPRTSPHDHLAHAADVIQRQVRLLAFGDYYPLEFRFNEQTRFLAIARIMNDFDVRLRIVAGSFRRNAWKDILED